MWSKCMTFSLTLLGKHHISIIQLNQVEKMEKCIYWGFENLLLQSLSIPFVFLSLCSSLISLPDMHEVYRKNISP